MTKRRPGEIEPIPPDAEFEHMGEYIAVVPPSYRKGVRPQLVEALVDPRELAREAIRKLRKYAP